MNLARRPGLSFLSPHLRLALALAALLSLLGTLARAAFALWFAPAGGGLDGPAHELGLGSAFLLGLRFDARSALVSVVLAWFLSALPWLGPRLRPPVRAQFWRVYWMLAGLVWALGLIVDAGHYAYLAQRLSSVLFTLARDAGEATGMVWQSYPVLWIALGLGVVLLLWHWAFALAWRWAVRHGPRKATLRTRVGEVMVWLLAAGLVHGKFSQYPLRWSDAAELPSAFTQALALNPLHNLFDTWTFREERFDAARLRPAANRVRGFVGLPPLQDGAPISLLRSVAPKAEAAGRPAPNVVLVLLESFAGHKVGALGSPLGATPNFDALAREGLLFSHMMSAHAHTARGVFATLTGLPDVSRESTASRNPAAADQFSIVNEFTAHKKFYFIGGSTSWANVRGLLAKNIAGIEIVEQTRLKSPVEDVWGVSDKNLLLEANQWLGAQEQPFFAVIQTSSNHRPYTIPAEDAQLFDPKLPPPEVLQQHGFISAAEYRSFAYLDWCIGEFMARARKEKYFANTLFAFVGDHGIIGATGPHYAPAWRELAITQGHTPLLIYAPGRVAARRIDSWAQQVDVLPTLAALAGIAHRNTTLGRDLLDPRFDATRIAFTFQFTGPGELGLLVGEHMLIDLEPPTLHDIRAAQPRRNLLAGGQAADPAAERIVREWAGFARDYDLIARYLQTHNKKRDAAP
jgi:glucan phosphoethanolaminetransferase (alkaline phosphatase superfamily)